jgi:phosphoserine phosphatase RsbU/P
MYMAMTRSLIRASAVNYSSPAGALKEVNQHLIAHSSSDMFVTVFYALLDAETQTLTYANAGQNPPLLRRAAGAIEQLTRTGAALGIIEELQLSDLSLLLAPGDSLVIYTDGVTDALNSQGEDYGLPRLMEAVANFREPNAKLQLDHLSKELNNFIKDTPPFDDVTFFILARE